MPSGRSVLFRAFDRHRPLPAWFPFSSRASSCMISSLHTISHIQIFANYTPKQDSSSNLAACDVFGQQEQRCVQGFPRARYQVAGHNKSIMWPCRVRPPRGSSLRPVHWGLHLELEMSQIQTTAAPQGMWPGKKKSTKTKKLQE